MKRTLKFSAIALSAAFAFSAMTACDKGPKEEKSNITADQVLMIGDSITETLSDMQSFTAGGSMKLGMSAQGYTMEENAQMSATVSLKGDAFNMGANVTLSDKVSIQGISETETERLSMYIIDDFGYVQDEEDVAGNVFWKTSRPVWDYLSEETEESGDSATFVLLEVFEMLMGAQGELELPEIPTDMIEGILNDEFTLIKKGDTTRVTLDLKQELNDLFSYVGNLSVNTKVSDVVNYALGHIDEDLTWQDITGAIKDKGGYTVGTIVNVLDNELYGASGMRLQDIKDAILSGEGVYEALAEEFGTDTADVIMYTSVEDIVSEYGSLTVDDLVQNVAEDGTVTLSSVITTIENAFAAMTIGDTFESEEEAVSFMQTVAEFKAIRINDLNANLIFTVKNDKLTRVEVSYNVNISVNVEGGNANVYVNASIYAEQFSDQAKTVALPTGSTVVIDGCAYCGISVTESDYCAVCRAYLCEDCHSGTGHNV